MMLTRYASHRVLPPRTNASAKRLDRSIVEGGEGERLSRPQLRRISGRRRIHSPTKTVRFSIVQTRLYEVMKEEVVDEDDIFSASVPPLRRVSNSVEMTRTALPDDEDGVLERLCDRCSFGGW